MAQIKRTQPLLPSVLDRLLDDHPEVREEPESSRTQVLRQLHQSIMRDLQNLLNTRSRCLLHDEHLAGIEDSLLGYGLPDFSSETINSAKTRDRLRDAMEYAIRRWEPRFKSVEVSFVDNANPQDGSLRFRIDALVYADPAPEPIIFDSMLDPSTYNFEIRGADYDR
ncbi:MAG: type VI secretion system baseplate subunit TssE [Gammaproteobacteria bacterium]|nr:type VI secretion system baseplate subunit TssE [Gammaproteobacteria bacterium]